MSSLNVKLKKCPICTSNMDEQRKTCSRECADKLKKIESREMRNCLECNIEFSVRKKDKRKICSDKCRKIWGAKPENKILRLQLAEEAVIKKHGVKSTLMLNEVKIKIKKSKLDKYGDENYNNYDKSKITNKEKYDVEHGLQSSKIRNKGKITRKEKYNDENFNNRQKAIDTSIEKFGTSHALKLDEYKEKQKQTNLNKYGVENPMQSELIKETTKKTNLKKYGFENVSQANEIKQKITQTWRQKLSDSEAYKLYLTLSFYNLVCLSDFKGITHPVYTTNDNSNIEYEFQCTKCDNKFIATFANYTIPVCRKCFPFSKNSKLQNMIRDFFQKNNIDFVENTRRIVRGIELDFFCEKNKIAIEVNGNFFHSERYGGKNEEYHINKTKKCYDLGIKLIHIFEDELIFKSEIVYNRLSNYFNIRTNITKIHARKCNIQIIDSNTCSNFLEKNHIQGNDKSSIKLGMFYNNDLISVMTFSKPRGALGHKNTTDIITYELVRFCSKINFIVPGGFQKLLNYFKVHYLPQLIITYADIRYSGLNPANSVYEKCGFTFIEYTKVNYWYFRKGNFLNRLHRYGFSKYKLLELIKNNSIAIDESVIRNLVEWDLAQLLQMDRIWDCGSMKFQLELK